MRRYGWPDEALELIKALRDMEPPHPWEEVAKHVSKKLGREVTADAARVAWTRYGHLVNLSSENYGLMAAKKVHSARRNAAFNARQLRQVLDHLESRDAVIKAIGEVADRIPRQPRKRALVKSQPGRWDMVLEAMLSDLHFGKLVRQEGKVVFNAKIARRRMREFARVVLDELEIQKRTYNVTGIIVALLGDIIESYDFHGVESARGCEFGTPRQVDLAIESILEDFLIPVAETRLPIRVPAVTGNHDRTQTKRTYVDPGENNWTWVIYQGLKRFMDRLGYANVKFYIPTGPYIILPIFGGVNNVLYEHLDNANGKRYQDLLKLMLDRGHQAGKVVDYIRGGHFHRYDQLDDGKVVINKSLVGADSYAGVRGWRARPGQVLNFYLDFPLPVAEGERRETFHKGFGVKLP